jgi:hypothetical protein
MPDWNGVPGISDAPELKNFLDIGQKHVSHNHGIDYKPINAKSGMLNQPT